MKKLKKCDEGGQPITLQGLMVNSPWQTAYQDPQLMQSIYNQRQPPSYQQMQPQQQVPQVNTQQTFGTPNWDYIFASQMMQNMVKTFANNNPNSRQNAVKDYNTKKNSPLNFLPTNPNNSLQDLYGSMKKGGETKPSFEDYYKTIPQEKNDTSNYNLKQAYQNLPYSQMQEFANTEQGHLPDTYKLSNHPTFSNESMYYDGIIPGLGGYWNDDNFIHNPQIGPPIPPQYKDGGKIPIFTENPNDPRLKAYQDSLTIYNAGLNNVKGLSPNGIQKFSENYSLKDYMNDHTDTIEEADKLHKLIKKTGINPIGTYMIEGIAPAFKKPEQPVIYQNHQIPQLNSIGFGNQDINIPFNNQSYPTPNISPIRKNDGDPVYAIGMGKDGTGAPLLGYYSNGVFDPSDENPNAAKYTSDEKYMKDLIKRNYGADYKVAEYKKGGGFKLNPAHKGDCTPITKSTCTGKKKTFALNAKHHFKKWKHALGGIFADGGEFDDEYSFLFGNEDVPEQDTIPNKPNIQNDQEIADPNDNIDFFNSLYNQPSPQIEGIPHQALKVNPNNIGIHPIEQGVQYRNYLINKGLSPQVAAGAVANFYAESSLNPSVTNSIGAKGLGQWLGNRKKALGDFAKASGKSVNDPYLQMDYMMHELQTNEKGAAQGLENITDPAQAALHFMNKYERPSDAEKAQSAKKRMDFANKLMQYKHGGEYNVSEEEFENLKKLGYSVQIL